MDPYLEDPELFSEFHGTMTYTVRNELNRLLPKGYVARLDRYLWVEDAATGSGLLLGAPDTYIHGPPLPSGGPPVNRPSSAPTTIVFPMRRRRQGNRFIRVIDPKNRRVVTVVEILSPANKRGSYRRAYRRKRSEYVARGVNLVEIDLLRTGRRLPLGKPGPPASDYYVLVTHAEESPRGDYWPISVRDELPIVPVPLDPGVPVVQVALRLCLEQAYQDCRFDEEIDYTRPANPPLREPDATWARELLAAYRPPAESTSPEKE